MRPLLFLCLALPVPALAEGLCDVTDLARLQMLAGTWSGVEHRSFETLDDTRMGVTPLIVTLADGGGVLTYASDLTSGLFDEAPALTLARDGAYDVDAVDDMLDTTAHAELADTLSDTLCGPEALPQLVVPVSIDAEIDVEGAITLIAYFSDRLLQITEMTVRSDEVVLYVTATALLTPQTGTQLQ
ncbi:hypothetical protein [Jannaschia sp. 2305UL9-9]|uniref:hypothetical protein n=1 Tax=Jannaschia sp. 2305UL9-9 TaxID=3121638 RepID=UPI0035286372